ncbi:MAG: aminoglycoside adenylyltransferase domain-containing protein [Candidatus Saccharimonadales bacterium]
MLYGRNLKSVSPYKSVNSTLEKLLKKVRDCLSDEFVGLYNYGSLAIGDFHLKSSDIDFLVVTKHKLNRQTIEKLRQMHKAFDASSHKWDRRLEGSYLPLSELTKHDPNAGPFPCVNEGRFYMSKHGSQWIIHRYVLRKHETIIYGPSLRDKIDPVTKNQLRAAQASVLQEKWINRLSNLQFLKIEKEQSYAVLTMSRALYVFKHGEVASKVVAANWSLESLDERWHGLVKRALATRGNRRLDNLELTQEFIRYTIQKANAVEQKLLQNETYVLDK